MITLVSHFSTYSTLILIGLFFALLVILECGRRIAVKRMADDPTGAKMGITEVEGAIFALLGLMIAFTFYGASQRLDVRRQMIVSETNAIGTAWLRIDILPDASQQQIRMLFKEYTQARLGINQKLPDVTAAQEQLAIANRLQDEIWQVAVLACKASPSPMVGLLVLPALNDMFDNATAHNTSLMTHPPFMIFFTLIFLILISSFYVGYALAGAKRANWLHGTGYALVMLGIFYVIIDFEFPRVGFIHLGAYDKPLIELSDKMGK
ncbi:MAG: hypothetical protein AB7I18_07775 [Candidatus Berkiella sp.]